MREAEQTGNVSATCCRYGSSPGRYYELRRRPRVAERFRETVLVDRVRFTPTRTAAGAAYDVRAEMMLGRVCAGVLDTERLASPTGLYPFTVTGRVAA
jgi:hypothetical protein